MIRYNNNLLIESNGTTYYHGCPDEQKAQQILATKTINPGNITVTRGSRATPVLGKTYLTQKLEDVLPYVFGFYNPLTGKEEYGYLFEVDSRSLSDLDPDEDAVGSLVYAAVSGKHKDVEFGMDVSKLDNYFWIMLKDKAKAILTRNQYQKVLLYNDFYDLILAGKKILKYLNYRDKLKIIELGCPVANSGSVKIKKAYRVDKRLRREIEKNSKKIFKLSTRVL